MYTVGVCAFTSVKVQNEMTKTTPKMKMSLGLHVYVKIISNATT